MAEQKMKVRDKQVQKMTKDGLVEKNLTNNTTVRVSKRAEDVRLYRNRSPSEKITLEKNPERASRKKRQNRRYLQNETKEKDATGFIQSKDKESRLLEEKHVSLSESRGDSRKQKTGGMKRPKRKQRLQFQEKEKISDVDEIQKNTIPFEPDDQKKDFQKAKQKKYYKKQKVRGKSKIQFDQMEKGEVLLDADGRKNQVQKALKGAGKTPVVAINKVYKDKLTELSKEDDGAKLLSDADSTARSAYRLHRFRKMRKQNKTERRLQKTSRYVRYFQGENSVGKEAVQKEKKLRLKALQKKQIQKEYSKKNTVSGGTTAAKGTVEYIKKIGGKVTNFFKEHQKVYISIGVFLLVFLILSTALSSCSAVFFQNAVSYAASGYISTDEAIKKADLYYTQKEADLQEKINKMQENEKGHDEYRYNIAPIEHDPFVLISYLSAKYEEFTFEQVKGELDTLFEKQYRLTKESVNDTITEKKMVKVGESLGKVITSGYCNCSLCCGKWAGGPTASGAMPKANHTLAVDAATPFVPMGTKIIMNGVEYKVEDTGNFTRYGVQFDVYYDNHAVAQSHGHKTWEAYIADDNGDKEVEVESTRTVDVLNVTLTNNDLETICKNRLHFFNKDLYEVYMETKGNLQMFDSPFKYNWYTCVSSNYGYRIHPVTGEKHLHQGIDIVGKQGTKVKAGLTGTVKISDYNSSYGNYVVIENSKGYELRYAHLSSRNVSAGQTITRGDVIGKVGSTGTSTGTYLHMEVLKNGERLNPIFYVETGTEDPPVGSEYCSGSAQALIAEAKKHLGTPYVWGGYAPGGFDCSGFVSYCLTKSGAMNTGHLNCRGLMAKCTKISKEQLQPGDLVFFQGTYNTSPPSHVGIYLGNGQFIHCGDPCKISSLNTSYWLAHWYCGGRW